MIARIAARGHSFKGAGLYYLHDKEASTSERVAWTEVRNIPTGNAEAATNYMAYTAMYSNRLKQEAGIPLTGRKREKGVVYTFSLSWSPEEKPTQELMVKSADETLELLGLQDHQSLIVAHNDTKHPHVHIICNLVNPTDGRMHDPDWGSKLKMSDWSLKYEFENGKVYCHQRVENHEKRKRGERVKYLEPLHDRKAEIQQIYRQSDNGKAFSAAIEEQGYTLAKGNRRRFVLVDKDGRIHSLSRQLDKEQKKGHLEKLSDLISKELPLAQDVARERLHYDRDKETAEQEQKIIDAAIEAEHQKQLQERKEKRNTKPKREGNKKEKEQLSKKDYESNASRRYSSLASEYDALIKWSDESQARRIKLEQELKQLYNRDKIVAEIEKTKTLLEKKKGFFSRYLDQKKKAEQRLVELQLSLENVDMRIHEYKDTLEKEIKKAKPVKGGQDRNLEDERSRKFTKKQKQKNRDDNNTLNR